MANAIQKGDHYLGLGREAKKPFPFTKPDILVPATDVKDSEETFSLNMSRHVEIYGIVFKILGVIEVQGLTFGCPW